MTFDGLCDFKCNASNVDVHIPKVQPIFNEIDMQSFDLFVCVYSCLKQIHIFILNEIRNAGQFNEILMGNTFFSK